MCKHVAYTTIVNFQIKIVYQRKIKNIKRGGDVWLIRVHTQNIHYFLIVTII